MTQLTVDGKTIEEFNLHVQLIRVQDGLKTAKALHQAWLEGPAGLSNRLKPTPATKAP